MDAPSPPTSPQDFYRLLAAGSVPVAFVLGTCVYHIAHQSAMQSLRQAGVNQEMVVFTQGIYEARELALSRMQAEAARAGAAGIVGVDVAVHNHVWGEHATEFFATGTAVRKLDPTHQLPDTAPKPTFTLGLDYSATRACGDLEAPEAQPHRPVLDHVRKALAQDVAWSAGFGIARGGDERSPPVCRETA